MRDDAPGGSGHNKEAEGEKPKSSGSQRLESGKARRLGDRELCAARTSWSAAGLPTNSATAGKARTKVNASEAGVCAPPTGNPDQRLSELRNESGAEADSRHGDAEREPALTIESRRDRLRVDQRRLAGPPRPISAYAAVKAAETRGSKRPRPWRERTPRWQAAPPREYRIDPPGGQRPASRCPSSRVRRPWRRRPSRDSTQIAGVTGANSVPNVNCMTGPFPTSRPSTDANTIHQRLFSSRVTQPSPPCRCASIRLLRASSAVFRRLHREKSPQCDSRRFRKDPATRQQPCRGPVNQAGLFTVRGPQPRGREARSSAEPFSATS